ncbi:MAG TPA: response regulator [Polyangiales bacterium]
MAIDTQTPTATSVDDDANVDESRLRILVVDDDEDLAHLLAKVLITRNYEVRTARDSMSAIRAAIEFAPDVALMDIGLPMMNGYELAREVRKILPAGKCRLIALTGFSEEGEKEKAREAGFEEHLLKPVNLATLRKAIERP